MDEGFAACSGIYQRIQFELNTMLRKMTVCRERWSTEYVV